MDIENEELIHIFLDEVEIHLDSLNEGLLQLEDDLANNRQNYVVIDQIFRAYHSIKGASGMMGLTKINRLTHVAENLLDMCRDKKITVTNSIIQALFESIDLLNSCIDELQGNGEDANIDKIVEKLEKLKTDNIEDGNPKEEDTEVANSSEGRESIKNKKSSFDVSKYLQIFIDDTMESVSSMEDALLNLDQNEDVEGDELKEAIDELFRRSHQIKGSSGTMAFTRVNQVSHTMENILEELRSHNIDLSKEIINALLEGVDYIKKCITNIDGTSEPEIDSSHVLKILSDFSQQTEGKKTTQNSSGFNITNDDNIIIAEAQASGKSVYKVTFTIDDSESLKGMRGFVAVSRLESIGDIIKSFPLAHELPNYNELDSVQLIIATDKDESLVINAADVDQVQDILVEKIEDCQPVQSNGSPHSEETSDSIVETSKATNLVNSSVSKSSKTSADVTKTMRVDVKRLDALMNMSGELVINKAQFIQIEEHLKSFFNQKALMAKVDYVSQSLEFLKSKLSKMKYSDSNTQQNQDLYINNIMSAVDEISEGLKKMEEGQSHYLRLQDATHQLELVSSELQKSVMDIRMVQIGPLFNRFKRVVRDVAKDVGKEVKLLIKGEDTELDKKLIDELGDPLTHIIRNSVDHGIEVPDQRQENGKSIQGMVTLNAYHKGNSICISISDDGKGIDYKAIEKRAVEKGIYTKEEIQKLSEKEIIQLIFHPGFSTAAKITNISGRGVGMDIVKKKIEELNGKIEINTVPGKGSEFHILLPLTLAIQKSLMCLMGDAVFALPLDYVREIISINYNDIKTIGDDKVVKVRGDIIPIKTFKQVFPNSHYFDTFLNNQSEEKSKSFNVVVLSNGQDSLGLIVDGLIGESDIVIKSLSDNFGVIPGIAGASILGDGKVALILDIATIIEKMTQLNLQQA